MRKSLSKGLEKLRAARWSRLVGPMIGAMLLLICGIVASMLLTLHDGLMRHVSLEASNVSAAITQDIARNLELYDLSIQGALENVGNPAVMEAAKPLRQLILFDRAATAPYLGKLLVLDRKGDIIADSTTLDPGSVNYADRDYFRIHVDRADYGLYVSRPLISRSDGHPIVALSRRITNPDGSFGGVVAGTLRLDYLRRLYGQMKLGPGGSLTLFRSDGTVVMRQPYDAAGVGVRQFPDKLLDLASRHEEGEYESVSVIDGVRRLFHYRRVGKLPLVQDVGFALDDVEAAWRAQAIAIGAVMILCCGVITLLAIVIGRELRGRQKAEAALLLMVDKDGLTGLANRRCLDRVLLTEWQRAVRLRLPLALLMIDADHFKLYNDSFGHAAGDEALRQLARCITASARRPGDLGARYGGEEFAVVLPVTDAAGALRVAELLRAAVISAGIQHPDSPTGLFSVSIGVASVLPRPGVEPQWLIEAADAALYRSKHDGRNRATLAPGTLRLVA